MRSALSFGAMPPVGVPLRFLLTAPLFGVMAALLLLLQPEPLLTSRWTGEALAATHLLTLGFLSLAMVGALMQILPVVGGIMLPHASTLGQWVHAALVAGTLVLSAAFLLETPLLFRLAMALLAGGFGAFIVAAWIGYRHGAQDSASVSTTTICKALAGLLATVSVGVLLASAFAGLLPNLPLLLLTDLHVAWGAAGWIGMLVAGVAFQVIPMFQATPTYPQRFARLLPIALMLLLCIGSLRYWMPAWAVLLSDAGLAASLATFAIVTLGLLAQRKRPRPDTTTRYWRLSMAALIGSALAWGMATRGWCSPVFAGGLFLAGFGSSAVSGMLYKIVPFLAWYHLQEQVGLQSGKRPPALKEFLSDRSTNWQFRLHAAAVLMLMVASAAPNFEPGGWTSVAARASAVLFAISFAWLWLNLMRAVQLHRSVLADQPS